MAGPDVKRRPIVWRARQPGSESASVEAEVNFIAGDARAAGIVAAGPGDIERLSRRGGRECTDRARGRGCVAGQSSRLRRQWRIKVTDDRGSKFIQKIGVQIVAERRRAECMIQHADG